jgi:hypothetical protein
MLRVRELWYRHINSIVLFKGRLHGAFLMCVSMSDKPFDAEACDIGGQASATNGLSDMKTHIENAPCNRPLTVSMSANKMGFFAIYGCNIVIFIREKLFRGRLPFELKIDSCNDQISGN